ncbi:LysR family transcriptional regulator, partial [Nocardia carnea]|uniref:LysR family transcriptional regulator n=1 Tax=Nocardia carnea TaxID=37328 RepID=UPI002458588D
MDLRKLRYFAAVAEHRHFGRAAQALYIAQPVLSRQIRAFEQELRCDLLVRTTRRVELTPAGEQLYTEARSILAAVETAVLGLVSTEFDVTEEVPLRVALFAVEDAADEYVLAMVIHHIA